MNMHFKVFGVMWCEPSKLGELRAYEGPKPGRPVSR